jgi:hypothetical protein
MINKEQMAAVHKYIAPEADADLKGLIRRKIEIQMQIDALVAEEEQVTQAIREKIKQKGFN